MSSAAVAAIVDSAIDKTGLNDFGSTFSYDAVEAWVSDVDHPRLNQTGKAAFASQMVGDLARRLRVIDCLKQNPEIDDVEIPPILYISGLERTGTTFLHNLLSLPANARPLLRWELMRPVPPPEAATYRSDSRIAATQASIDKLRGTQLEQMHWVDADDPEECQWGMIDGSSILGGAAFPVMPNWAQTLRERDAETGFLEYRQMLKLLLWKNPVPQGGHLVLKCPQFCQSLANFSKVFPEARFVLTHRDPFRVVVSLRTMLGGILTPFLAEGHRPDDSPDFVQFLVDRIEERVPLLASFSERKEGVVNIAYPDLVREPAAAALAVYRELGFDAPEDFPVLIKDFVRAQKQGKRAKPPRELPNYGLDHVAFLERSPIADYCTRLQIEPEVRRQTGA